MDQSKKQQRKILQRFAQAAIASAAFALLTACGGGDSSSTPAAAANNAPPGGVSMQVVSFGTSLSDAGTYSGFALPNFGGGRYTTNPGQVWTQNVANYYGGTLTPAFIGGFKQPLAAAGGLDYAQGGAEVTNPQGLGWAPNNLAQTTTPIATQVANYLAAHGSFNSGQLVLIEGGANDILANLTALLTAIQTDILVHGMTPQAATLQEVSTTLGPAAQALATQVATIVAKGGTHVVFVNVPDIGQTPLGVQTGLQQGAAAQQLISGVVQTFNAIVAGTLQAANLPAGAVIQVDAFTWLDQLIAAYQTNGFSVSNTNTACNLTTMQTSATAYAQANPSVLLPGQTAAQFGAALASSLFCSPQTLTAPGADQSYMFADIIHPSTRTHVLFAQYVQSQIAKAGIGH